MSPVLASYLTHRGYLRSGNEDSILVAGRVVTGISMERSDVLSLSRLPALFCVADGIGGAAFGEVASREVLEYFAKQSVPVDEEGIIALVAGAKEVLDSIVLTTPSSAGLGTTIAGIVLLENGVIVFNSGDSRVYLIETGKIERLSHDHSLVQELCDSRVITDEQVYTHPYRNIITASISGDPRRPFPAVRVIHLPRTRDEQFLLCTDGVWEVLRDEMLLTLSSYLDIRHAADAILSDCLAGGGPDNISLILIRDTN